LKGNLSLGGGGDCGGGVGPATAAVVRVTLDGESDVTRWLLGSRSPVPQPTVTRRVVSESRPTDRPWSLH